MPTTPVERRAGIAATILIAVACVCAIVYLVVSTSTVSAMQNKNRRVSRREGYGYPDTYALVGLIKGDN